MSGDVFFSRPNPAASFSDSFPRLVVASGGNVRLLCYRVVLATPKQIGGFAHVDDDGTGGGGGGGKRSIDCKANWQASLAVC